MRITDLRTQLQSSLGVTCTLERELGGGGMSRVFVAQEHALGRAVVVKVLSPDVSASVSAEAASILVASRKKISRPEGLHVG